MRLHELLRDGKSEAGATARPGPRLVGPIKSFEHVRQVVRAYPRARIRDGYLDAGHAVGNADLYSSPLGCMPQRIAQQVGQHLADAEAIDTNIGMSLHGEDIESHAPAIGEGLEVLHYAAYQLSKVGLHELKTKLPGLCEGECAKVLHESRQEDRLIVDSLFKGASPEIQEGEEYLWIARPFRLQEPLEL